MCPLVVLSRRAIREALMSGSAGGQDIVEELDALTLQSNSPKAADGVLRERNLMSPHSTDWSRALGWAGGSPFSQPQSIPYEERPNSPDARPRQTSHRPIAGSL